MSKPGGKRVHKEMRKVVPRYRRWNMKTAAGQLCKIAYQMDMTRKEIAEALGMSVQGVNAHLITHPHRITPQLLDRYCEALALSESETIQLHRIAAMERGWRLEASNDSCR